MFWESQSYFYFLLAATGFQANKWKRILKKRLVFWPRFFKPTSEVKSETHLPTAIETTERKKWQMKARDSQFWKCYFPLWKYGQRDHVFRKLPSWSNRKKRAVVFLKEMLRKDVHSFVPQVFHLLQQEECLHPGLPCKVLGLPDQPWEPVSRSSLASLDKRLTCLLPPEFWWPIYLHLVW